VVLAAAGAAALPVREARADVTSWMALGGGGTSQRNRTDAVRDGAAVMTYSMGVGSSPLGAIVVGGLFRGTTMFGLGTDLGLGLRATTGGFSRGNWGVALDAGPVWRSWGNGTHGDWPLQAVLTAGFPWGFQLAAGAEFWTISNGTSAQGFFAALELDLLRLTVMRQGGTERWWPNPAPAGGHTACYGCGSTRGGGFCSSALIE
jgi:hypothetical protein